MRKFFLSVSLLLLAGLFIRPAQAADQPLYPLQVHVISCESRADDSNWNYFQVLSVTLEGRKLQLESYSTRQWILHPGDYRARMVKESKNGAAEYSREYELLLSDGKTVKYTVIGESE
jgi:hypothetical protein